MNLKTGVLTKQSTPNFPKNEHFLLPNTSFTLCPEIWEHVWKKSDGEVLLRVNFFMTSKVSTFIEGLNLRLNVDKRKGAENSNHSFFGKASKSFC